LSVEGYTEMREPPLENEIYYPESDGRPVAETELHFEVMFYVWQSLKERFRAESDVFVGANLFLYYQKGDPTAVVAPDAGIERFIRSRTALFSARPPASCSVPTAASFG
jgi:hypothetical protein